MRFTTYTKYRGGWLDALNLQELLDRLAEFLLQGGFAGTPQDVPWWADPADHFPDRSLEALKEALLRGVDRERPAHPGNARGAARRWGRGRRGSAADRGPAGRPRPAAGRGRVSHAHAQRAGRNDRHATAGRAEDRRGRGSGA